MGSVVKELDGELLQVRGIKECAVMEIAAILDVNWIERAQGYAYGVPAAGQPDPGTADGPAAGRPGLQAEEFTAQLRLWDDVVDLTVSKGGALVVELSRPRTWDIRPDPASDLPGLLAGTWSQGWGTKDNPPSLLHWETYQFFRDGKLRYWTEEHQLAARRPEPRRYDIEAGPMRWGSWKQIGPR